MKITKAAVRGQREVSDRLRQSRNISRQPTPRERRRGRISADSSLPSQGQKKLDSFSSEEPYLLEQFVFPRNEPIVLWTGSRRLLLGVLQDALRSFFQYRCSHTRAGKRIFHETYAWLLSSEQRWLYSFENVCAHLGLNPEYLRAGLRRFLQETEKPQPRNGAEVSSLSSKSHRRPFRLISGPGSRVPRRSQHPALRENGERAKA
jgi:hypothetical protein